MATGAIDRASIAVLPLAACIGGTFDLKTHAVTPIVNLVWAPVFVIELAHAEDSQARLRGPITAWWIAWIFATGLAIFASATSFTTRPQGIADNTVTTIITSGGSGGGGATYTGTHGEAYGVFDGGGFNTTTYLDVCAWPTKPAEPNCSRSQR